MLLVDIVAVARLLVGPSGIGGGPSVQNKSVPKSWSYFKSLGAVVIPVEIRRRVFTQSFCFVYLFVCLFFERQGGYTICELSSEGVLEVSKSNLKL